MSWPLHSRTGAAISPRKNPSSVTSSSTDSPRPLRLCQSPLHISSPTPGSSMSGLDTTRSSVFSVDPSTPEEGSPSSTLPKAPKKFNRPFSQHIYKEAAQNLRYSQPEFVASGIFSHGSEAEVSQAIQAAPETQNTQPKELDGSKHAIRSKPENHGRRKRQPQQEDQPFTAWKYRDPMYIHPYLGTPCSSLKKSFIHRGQRARSSSVPSRLCHTRPFPRAHGLPCDVDEARSALMVMWLYQKQLQNRYADGEGKGEGVVLKLGRDSFTCCPATLRDEDDGVFDAAQKMNVRCAMTVNTIVIRALVEILNHQELSSMPLGGGLQVQILKSIKDLPGCQIHQFAAFIEDKQILVVWDDDPKAIFDRAKTLEKKAMALVWPSDQRHSVDSLTAAGDSQHHKTKAVGDDSMIASSMQDLEDTLPLHERSINLTSSCIVALSLMLCISALGLGWRLLARNSTVDGDWKRTIFLVTAPINLFISLFFFYSLVSNFFLMLGSSKSVKSNSKYYSGQRPRSSALAWKGRSLPHVTIQMPVYREGLLAGGTANIFINDDGMQLLSESKAQEQRDFYDEHNVGWVARPKHNPPCSSRSSGRIFRQLQRPLIESDERTVDAQVDVVKPESAHFIRHGKFKKASNMNHALHISNRVDKRLVSVDRPQESWSWASENAAYNMCLAETLAEDPHGTWASGNIRMGDYILVIDSDTRVPTDFLLDGVTEMDQSPDVAILQYTSGVLQLTDSYFENGTAWFANLIYSTITFAVASGDCCPFVGHNALIRWSAIQDSAAYHDGADGREKYWSESHVSEDFDMAMRLQMAGWTLRYVAYTGTTPAAAAENDTAAKSFAEGLSLTVYDELARWEKYAYGCSELLFNPLWQWPTKGPFTRRFVSFVLSPNIRPPAKITVVSYMGTYYAVAVAWIIALFNFFFMGFFSGLNRSFYLDAFAIYISLLFVFPFMGNVALAAHRYRLGQKNIVGALLENFKWVPMFTIFLGGIPIHLSQAIAAHILGIDMTWGSTAKEVEEIGFVDEMARVLRRFRWSFLMVLAGVPLILACRFLLPREWQITEFFAIFPLAMVLFCHAALPILLNPALMSFSW
ncbi:hypothetical protein PspLS_05818 [Pyricularia sp. CBS 133598]|nr:hypothetical protein PspLS_05818 [Pyricularia sp. CBS 133598]